MGNNVGQLVISNLHCLHIGPLDLTVDAGQCISCSGPSGAGKSILLRAIIDLIPNKGEVWLGEWQREQMRASDWRKMVGLLPAESFWWCNQVGPHFPALTEQQLGWFQSLGFDKQVLDWEVARCSSGERQRLALLRLLCHGPKALLLDEPTANLDSKTGLELLNVMRTLNTEFEMTFIFSTHDEKIMKMATRLVSLVDGQIAGDERKAST